jgi:uncharacterized damage-inducible protein DinB
MEIPLLRWLMRPEFRLLWIESMPETARIADQLKRAFAGDAWHGPALMEILAGVDAANASARPIATAHTIWELTLHITAWDGVILRRIAGKAASPTDEENFPTVKDSSGIAWRATLAELQRRHQELLGVISEMPDSRLSEQVPGKDYDFYFLLHGTVQHTLYHAGQIVLLKRALG